MVTFVPAFVSEECRQWDRELAAEMRERGLDPRIIAAGRGPRPSARRGATRAPNATVAQVADHVEHVREVAGVEHVGIGGDFDGTDQLPEGLEDVSGYPALFAELLRRGWSEADLARAGRRQHPAGAAGGGAGRRDGLTAATG